MSALYTVTVPAAPNEVNRPLMWLGQKAPGDDRQYALNCLPWLNGDLIETVSVNVAPNGPGDIVASGAGAQDVGKAVVTLTGGNAGTTYAVTFTVSTIGGDVLVRTAWLFCQNLSPSPPAPATVQAVIPSVLPPVAVLDGAVTLDTSTFGAFMLAWLAADPDAVNAFMAAWINAQPDLTSSPSPGWKNNGGIAQLVYPE
jgi:hypothetical protein